MQAFDTNILAYAAGLRRIDSDEPKIAHAAELFRTLLIDGDVVLPAQILAELHHLLRRKMGLPAFEASQIAEEYAAGVTVIPTDQAVLASAFGLAEQHGLQTYDAIVLAAAAQAECEVLYSEDMQDRFVWRGVRVVNPFG